MDSIKSALDRLVAFEDAASRIGVSIEVLAEAQPGALYSRLNKVLSRREAQNLLDGIEYLSALYDRGNLENLKRTLQTVIFEKDGIKWKSKR